MSKMNGWIDAKKQLPSPEQTTVIFLCLVDGAYMELTYFADEGWFDEDTDTRYEVDYWQPYPLPPEYGPRLLTLEEVWAVDPHTDYLWVETSEDYDVYHLQVYGYGGFTDQTIFFDIPQDTLECDAKAYGKYWRCWSDCPTYEQRDAVKWDEGSEKNES